MSERIQIPIAGGAILSAIHKTPHVTHAFPKNALVVMCHDFPGHKTAHNDLFGDIEFQLVEKGYSTLRFDFRHAMPDSGTQQEFMIKKACEDLRNIMFWAESHGFDKYVFIGAGIGSTVQLMNHPDGVKAMIMFWPVLDLKTYGEERYQSNFLDQAAVTRGYIEDSENKIGIKFLHELHTTKLDYAFREVKTPILAFHGDQDKSVPVRQLNVLRKEFKTPRIEITTFHDGEHGLTKMSHRKAIFYQIEQFIMKYT